MEVIVFMVAVYTKGGGARNMIQLFCSLFFRTCRQKKLCYQVCSLTHSLTASSVSKC